MISQKKAFFIFGGLAIVIGCLLGPISTSCNISELDPLERLFVGFTQATFDGNIGGYSAGRAACEAEYGLGTHVCTAGEISRSLQLDLIKMESGALAWYFAARGMPFINGLTECQGWTSGEETYSASCLYQSPEGPIFPAMCTCLRDGVERNPIPLSCCRFIQP